MSYYTCSKCGKGGLNQYGHGKIDGTFSCDNKPEPKKEKPMANLDINVQLFDGLSLYQRIRAVIEIETAITNARELRTRMANSDGDIDDKSNGTFVSRYVIEDALCKLQRRLIDSTVEKFGGGE